MSKHAVIDKSPRERLLASLPARESRLELAGISTAVLEAGDGPPLVLLHGPGAYAAHWSGMLPGLARDFRVVAPDLPGHGASAAGAEALDAARFLDWLGELIWRTCSSPPALVGQLAGGALATRFAIAHPARVRHLALVDTFGLAPFQPAPDFAQALTGFLAHPDAARHEALWRHCAHDLDALRRRMGAGWEPFAAYNIERAGDPAAQGAVAALMREFAQAIPRRDLERLATPTALFWGRHDRATPLAVAESASARYGWPLHVIEDCNDDPPVEQPEALLRALHAVLAPSFSEAGG
jgi:pimeloyl-ACP methyl ester carboxylesterase